jgi:hypothetical protein
MRRSMWVVMLAAVLSITAAACGGSSSSGSSSNPGASSSPSSSTPSSSTSGGSVSDATFCASAKKAIPSLRKEAESLATQLGSGPGALKQLIQKEQSILQAFTDVAPSDIKPSMMVVDGQFNKLVNILAKHNYNFAEAGPELAKVNFESPAVKQAEAKLQAWGKTQCGLKS